jgi:hypothetical protein
MATTPEEGAGSSSTTDAVTHSPARPSEFDLTEASTGRVWRQYLRATGPGLVTGASDDDPSGIATYSQAGDRDGLSFLWAALLTLPLMAAVQEICDPHGACDRHRARRAGRQAIPPGRSSDPRSAPRRPHSGERPQHCRGSGRHRLWDATPPRRTDVAHLRPPR